MSPVGGRVRGCDLALPLRPLESPAVGPREPDPAEGPIDESPANAFSEALPDRPRVGRADVDRALRGPDHDADSREEESRRDLAGSPDARSAAADHRPAAALGLDSAATRAGNEEPRG